MPFDQTVASVFSFLFFFLVANELVRASAEFRVGMGGSLDMVRAILKDEGISGLFAGASGRFGPLWNIMPVSFLLLLLSLSLLFMLLLPLRIGGLGQHSRPASFLVESSLLFMRSLFQRPLSECNAFVGIPARNLPP